MDERGLRVALPTNCGRGTIVEPNAVRFCIKPPHDETEDHESIFRGTAISWSDVHEGYEDPDQ